MTGAEALRFLEQAGRFGELGLERIEALLEALGEPQRGMRFYHVAGTNGKGSTAAVIDRCLRQMGRRTGRFISPHLERPHERITVDGQEIPTEALSRATEEAAQASLGLRDRATEFELWTAIALLHMRSQGVSDVAWETGLGGRFDATNAVVPEVSVITSIGLDHVDRLGGTLESIAAQKAGILKPGRPAAIGELVEPARAIVRAEAARTGSHLWEIGQEVSVTEVTMDRTGTGFRYRDPQGDLGQVRVGLIGVHQAQNAALAIAALRLAGQGADASALREGLLRTRWPGRFEIVPGQPDVVLDGAHNPPGFAALADTWARVYGSTRPVVVFGCLSDRDARAMTEPLRGIAASWHTASPGGARALSAEDAAEAVGGEPHGSPQEALQAALAEARGSGRPVLGCGSLYLVGALRSLLTEVTGLEQFP